MNHLIVIPVVLPAIVAALTLLGMRFRLWLGRALSFAAVIGLLGVAIALLGQADTGLVQSYSLGNWPAPFGIVLVLDRLSALMLGLTALLATVVLAHAVLTGLDRRGWHFHPLFHFQLLGLNGAFLTGDLFNLFVFFEVLLIASYGLMLHGQGAARLQAGVQYVIVNLVGSLAMGLLIGWLARSLPAWAAEARLFVAVGVLGGFTTFSAFSLDTITLIERGAWDQAGLYILLSVVLCLAGLYCGLLMTRGFHA
jgi:multicomponent K+:H+ antiporter subunit D